MRPHPSAWNKGRLLGQKPPLKPKEIWSLRIRLQLAGKLRDLALFNLALDSKRAGNLRTNGDLGCSFRQNHTWWLRSRAP
jgi:hypothetical protein